MLIENRWPKLEIAMPLNLDIFLKTNRWVYDGFSETYRGFGMTFYIFYKGLITVDMRGKSVYRLPESL